jgi:hypothetical protein
VASTTYTVIASDSSAQKGELATPAGLGAASVTVIVGTECGDTSTSVPEDVDASGDATVDLDATDREDGWGNACPDPEPAPWSGCMTVSATGPPYSINECASLVGTTPSWKVSLPKPLLAGQTYQMIASFNVYDLIAAPQYYLWATTASCSQSQVPRSTGWATKDSTLSDTWTVPFCFVPNNCYTELVLLLEHLDASIAGATGVYQPTSFQICTGCESDP